MDIFKQLYYEFPDRPDRVAWVGNSCPLKGTLPGNDTHKGDPDWYRFDVNYFTKCGVTDSTNGNGTQYNRTMIEHGWTDIWKRQEQGNMVLDESKFDLERNFLLMKYALEEFQFVRFATTNFLWEYVKSKIPRSEYQPLVTHIAAGSDMGFNHHTHLHIDIFGNKF